jgi:hypothetical protein
VLSLRRRIFMKRHAFAWTWQRRVWIGALALVAILLAALLLADWIPHQVPLSTQLQDFSNLMLPLSAVFVLVQYIMSREGESNLKITVAPSVLSHTNGSAVLVAVQVTLLNTGTAVVKPGKYGCTVLAKRLDESYVQEGVLPLQNLEVEKPEGYEPIPSAISVDILKPYRIEGDNPYSNYELEPGCEYHELGLLALDPGSMFQIEASFHLAVGGTVREFSVFRVPDSAKTRSSS